MKIEYPYELIGEGYIDKFWLDNTLHIKLPINKDLLEKKIISRGKYKIYIQLEEE
jgi:hypothetical protein